MFSGGLCEICLVLIRAIFSHITSLICLCMCLFSAASPPPLPGCGTTSVSLAHSSHGQAVLAAVCSDTTSELTLVLPPFLIGSIVFLLWICIFNLGCYFMPFLKNLKLEGKNGEEQGRCSLCDSIVILSWNVVNGGSMIQTLKKSWPGFIHPSETRWSYYGTVCALGRGPVESSPVDS